MTVENNHIRDNTAGSNDGGGVLLWATTATLINNDISGNYTGFHGGGGALWVTTATLTNNNISGNTGNQGGGLYLGTTTATLTNNTLQGNAAELGGGAFLTATTAALINNHISGNTAGGGVFLWATTATLTNNDISGNTTAGQYGGGVSLTAATATLTNNTLEGNIAAQGGGISVSFRGSASESWVAFYNNIFWQNQATWNSGADFYIQNTLASQVKLFANNFDWTPTTGYWVGTPVYLDASNLDKVAPLFVDQSNGDLHLMPASPMIDAGYPATPDLPATDRAGGLRVVNGIVDIGAYEYHKYESCDV